MKLLHAIVYGKVQGVWFRAWTRDTALEMGIQGWVSNVPSGQVEITAIGEESVLKRFLERLHDGPPLARVERVEATWGDAVEPFKKFEVRR